MSQPPQKEDKTFFGSIAADLAAGALSGVLVGPFISAVDKALAENASGRNTLGNSFKTSMRDLVRHPIKFFKSPSFWYIWMVYGSTYMASNLIDSYSETSTKSKSELAFTKWVGTSTVNTSTCMIKDAAFARMFGSSAQTTVPMRSYATWLSRDLISMGLIFTAPPIVAKEIAEVTGNEKAAYYSAQFLLPLLMQTFTTPLHLLGFDIANNPNGTLADRVAFMKKDYFRNVAFRMLRMLAPWSLGTIGNRELRAFFKEQAL